MQFLLVKVMDDRDLSTHSSLPSSVSPLLLLSSSGLVPFYLSCPFPSTLHLFPVFLFFFLIKKKFFFFLGHKTCEIFFPRPGIEHAPSALEAQILNHWTARDVPQFPCCCFFSPLSSPLPLASAPLASRKQCPVLFYCNEFSQQLDSLALELGPSGHELQLQLEKHTSGCSPPSGVPGAPWQPCDDLSCFSPMKRSRWVGVRWLKKRKVFSL